MFRVKDAPCTDSIWWLEEDAIDGLKLRCALANNPNMPVTVATVSESGIIQTEMLNKDFPIDTRQSYTDKNKRVVRMYGPKGVELK